MILCVAYGVSTAWSSTLDGRLKGPASTKRLSPTMFQGRIALTPLNAMEKATIAIRMDLLFSSRLLSRHSP